MKKKTYNKDITLKQQKKEKDINQNQPNQQPNLLEKPNNELYVKMLVDQYLELSKNTNIYSEKRLYLIIVSLVSTFLSYIMGDYPLIIAVGIIYTLIIIKEIVVLDFSPYIINDYTSFEEIEDKTDELLNEICECYKTLECILKKYIRFEIIVIAIFIMLKVKVWNIIILVTLYLMNIM